MYMCTDLAQPSLVVARCARLLSARMPACLKPRQKTLNYVGSIGRDGVVCGSRAHSFSLGPGDTCTVWGLERTSSI